MRLGVKTLDECGKTDSSESQPYSTYRQQSMQQKDKLSANTTGNNRAFTDLNLGPARGSIHSPTPSFKIDYVRFQCYPLKSRLSERIHLGVGQPSGTGLGHFVHTHRGTTEIEHYLPFDHVEIRISESFLDISK